MKNLDLVQLRTFLAVFREGNVSRAALTLESNQSTVSKEIAKLRLYFGDVLFLRTAQGVEPTHKARALAPRIEQALSLLDDLLLTDKEQREPLSLDVRFRVATTEYLSYLLIPALTAHLQRHAPQCSLEVLDMADLGAEDWLLGGRADLVLSSSAAVSYPLFRQELFHDRYVVVMRACGRNGQAMDLDEFCRRSHIGVPGHNGSRERRLADALQTRQLQRQVQVSLPHFLAVPGLLARTDFVISLAERMARLLCVGHNLDVLDHPLDLAPFCVCQTWHERTRASSAYAWFREQVSQVCSEL
ncbi:LysR family transcriptional regulator [Alcaligenes sp. SORT26]|uniref:LysR family transcriptional regulator n=1 Tax=Alcaligenes sp. SORT26 TaxID=2813780 RepID=UPI001A9F0EA0|nr:LysR family transcriptional regulator [Alcaligenes sp. SORT26]QTB98317.1 LysR family transcriptional regulator [Alcaligenes sp. SORT26]